MQLDADVPLHRRRLQRKWNEAGRRQVHFLGRDRGRRRWYPRLRGIDHPLAQHVQRADVPTSSDAQSQSDGRWASGMRDSE